MDVNADDIINGLTVEAGENLFSKDSEKRNDYQELRNAFLAERIAPELLEFKTRLLDRIMNRLRLQMEYIEENSLEMVPGNDIKFKLLIVETEVERIKYVLRGYLRTRLQKITEFALFIKNDESQLAKLSGDEQIFMKRHTNLLHQLYKNQFLNSIPEALQSLEDNVGGISMIDSPDLNKAVFFKVKKTIEEPIRVGQDLVSLEAGSIYVLRYSAIAPYLYLNSIELI